MAPEVIGREDELAVVHAFLDRPPGGLRALVLEGEAGIGKSTIWQAGVAAAHDRGATVLSSRPAETELSLPNVVLGDLFGDLRAEVLEQLAPARRRALETALLLGEGADLPPDPRALGVAISSVLTALAEAAPVVLAIDDDQWMDASSSVPLQFALRRQLAQPIQLVLARRAGLEPQVRLEMLVAPDAVTMLRIGPLTAGATQALVEQRLGAPLRRRDLIRLHEASGGNPFFALELARAGAFDAEGGPDASIVVPATLERLVEQRLGSLDQQARDALLLVAANGRLAIELLPALELDPRVLAPARAANVVATADGVISFTHPLLASAVYQGASPESRRSAHRRLAASTEDPLLRGRHLALSSDEPEAGLAAELEAAASEARHRGLPIAATELGLHAVRLTPVAARSDRLRRGLATVQAIAEGGDGERARAMAADLVAAASPGPERAEAQLLRAELVGHTGAEVAVEMLMEALTDAASAPRLEARIHANMAEWARFTKGGAWAEVHANESLRIAEQLDDPALRAAALLLVARLRHERGDPGAVDLAEGAFAIAQRQSDWDLIRTLTWGLADVLAFSGETEHARAWIQEQLRAWGDRDEMGRWELHWYLSWVDCITGRWQAADEHAQAARAISEDFGIERAQDHHPAALIALYRGDLALGRRHAEQGLAVAGGQVMPYVHAALAICELWSGDLAAALRNFDEAEVKADVRGWVLPTVRWWTDWHAEALLEAGRTREAATLIAAWEATAVRMRIDYVAAQAKRGRGLVASANGDLAQAEALLDEAARDHAQVDDPFGRARALLALGVVRLRLRHKRSARDALEAAVAGFEALGAERWASTARDELARIGGRRRIEGLSASELRVAELIANGRTNREVAAALFLGERTVASHLTHIYAKLGIRSRTELARQLPRSAGGPPAGLSPDS